MTDHTDIVECPDAGELEAWRATADELLRERNPSQPTLRRAAHLLQNAYLFGDKAAAEITRLRAEAAELRSVMIAAAEEIQAHWPAHCDAEGYGPANLMRRLEDGIPSQYAYTAGDFERLRAEAEALRKDYPGDRKLLEAVSRYSHSVLQELQFERGTNSLAAHNLRLTMIEVEKALRGDRGSHMECGVGFPLSAIDATKGTT